MKKLIMLLVAIGLVFGFTSAMAKKDSSCEFETKKVYVCHYPVAHHGLDYLCDNNGQDYCGPCEVMEGPRGQEVVGHVIHISVNGWINGHCRSQAQCCGDEPPPPPPPPPPAS